MAVVVLAATVTKDKVRKIKEKKNRNTRKKDIRGAPCDNNMALLAFCDVFFSLINSRVFMPYLGFNFSWSFT
jgi:hypothetical protein